jgi:hypothetical protein
MVVRNFALFIWSPYLRRAVEVHAQPSGTIDENGGADDSPHRPNYTSNKEGLESTATTTEASLGN